MIPFVAFAVVLFFNNLREGNVSDLVIYLGWILVFLVSNYYVKDRPAKTLIVFGIMAAIMMIVGIFVLINHNDSFLGTALVGVGGFWFLSRYSDIPVKEYFSEYWPVILIILGIALIFKRQGKHQSFTDNHDSTKFDLDYVDDISIFGGGRKLITSQNFRGGKTTVILGGTTIDLHEANLAEGHNSLTITAMFGGIEVIVPRDWKVIVNVTSIFGGVDDKRILNPDQVYESNKVLIIRGTAIFGGCELKNY